MDLKRDMCDSIPSPSGKSPQTFCSAENPDTRKRLPRTARDYTLKRSSLASFWQGVSQGVNLFGSSDARQILRTHKVVQTDRPDQHTRSGAARWSVHSCAYAVVPTDQSIMGWAHLTTCNLELLTSKF